MIATALRNPLVLSARLSRLTNNVASGSGFRAFSSKINAVYTLADESAIQNFRKIHSEGKSILYFTANWCPPCKTIKPIYEKLSNEHTDIAFGKVDIDDNAEAAMEFKVSSVPTFILFNGEEKFDTFAGADKNRLETQAAALSEL
eukprot:CAMPEP_0198248696 /NCGR_PEP_ID=MMETSP1447-20131203/427_1 /TAXON_ID=420782 /ORGANISM="Chaetoceros dichaeta, Strain CCMP1751" /LENGTH=144 /DNA_ID=CAMNT_0043933171 /DNA_START=30 /DNA_END=467 /DNA_ORIENTATION=-